MQTLDLNYSGSHTMTIKIPIVTLTRTEGPLNLPQIQGLIFINCRDANQVKGQVLALLALALDDGPFDVLDPLDPLKLTCKSLDLLNGHHISTPDNPVIF